MKDRVIWSEMKRYLVSSLLGACLGAKGFEIVTVWAHWSYIERIWFQQVMGPYWMVHLTSISLSPFSKFCDSNLILPSTFFLLWEYISVSLFYRSCWSHLPCLCHLCQNMRNWLLLELTHQPQGLLRLPKCRNYPMRRSFHLALVQILTYSWKSVRLAHSWMMLHSWTRSIPP